MIRIAVLNIKGGSGKSTLATTLAAWIAQCGRHVALVDYDPQESATAWLNRRPADRPHIAGVSAKGSDVRLTRVYRLVDALNTEFAVIDTPAALPVQELIYYCRDAHKVLLPVLPSRIDTDVCARMIRHLHVHGGIKKRGWPAGDYRKPNSSGYACLQTIKKIFGNTGNPRYRRHTRLTKLCTMC